MWLIVTGDGGSSARLYPSPKMEAGVSQTCQVPAWTVLLVAPRLTSAMTLRGFCATGNLETGFVLSPTEAGPTRRDVSPVLDSQRDKADHHPGREPLVSA